jgi:hypothetical protein
VRPEPRQRRRAPDDVAALDPDRGDRDVDGGLDRARREGGEALGDGARPGHPEDPAAVADADEDDSPPGISEGAERARDPAVGRDSLLKLDLAALALPDQAKSFFRVEGPWERRHARSGLAFPR